MKKLFLSAAIALIALASCKKESISDAKAITVENIIGSYKITAMSYTMNGVKTDGMEGMEACSKDDLYIFKTADLFDYSDAGTQCEPIGDYSSSWTLAGDTISVDGETAKVTSLTATTMETTSTVSEQGITITTTTTLTRQ